MGVLGLLLVAAFIFVMGNFVLLPLLLAATSLAGAITAPGRLLPLAGSRRLRRNHALEHATLNVLEEKMGGPQRVAGQSTSEGFALRGFADPETVRQAAEDALVRLKKGERRLAVHKRCGTSIAMANLVSSLALLVGLLGLGRLSLVNVVLAMVVANLSGPFLGSLAQRYLTTDPDVNDLLIIDFRYAVGQHGWASLLVNPLQAGVPVICFIRTAVPRLLEDRP